MADEFTPSSPDTGTPPPRTTGGNWRWEPPTAEELQALMPGYTIEKLLGRGGMGAVYLGVQQNLDRRVAIKILPPGVEKEDAGFGERFKSEAKLMAKLNHPAIVTVYDFGTTLGGQLYFAMEYVDGSDVSQMIQAQGRLPPEHALAITAHVCDALGAAHELGIVHRDIKPANVLINMKGQVKVADFGLAKVAEPGQHGMTKTGYAMGTPDFVAPESLMLGTAVDGRADLYAVGVMLYQMLTGSVPRGAFKPASVLVRGLDPRYDPIIFKAMQNDREERHQSSAELRQALDVILTVPLVSIDAPVSAAIPVAVIAEKPVGKGPRPKATPAVAVAVQSDVTPAKASSLTWMLPTALSAIVILGGAFFMRGKLASTPAEVVAPVAKKAIAATPVKVTEVPKVAPPKVGAPPKSEPKPVVSKSSDPPFPPGKWVKMFTKQEDLPENVRQTGSRRSAVVEDGWIKPAQKSVQITLPLPDALTTNYAVRARFRYADSGVQRIVLRTQSNSTLTDLFQLRTLDGGTGLTCQRREPGQDYMIANPTIQRMADQQEYVLQFGVVGSQLIGHYNSALAFVAKDTHFPRGAGAIYINDGIVRDIEVINLDGLPEEEALKVLGVDEKGNDLRAKPSPGTPPAVVATPPAAFPPGQWVKVVTKTEELPEILRKAGVTFEGGWIRSEAGKAPRLYLLDSLSNYAIRATMQRQGKEYQTKSLMIRAANLPSVAGYVLCLSTEGFWFAGRKLDGSPIEILWQAHDSTVRVPRIGEEYTLEWGCVGDKLIGRIGKDFVKLIKDTKWSRGPAYFTGGEPIREIEVINLDGLSEAEALRILGVDEKGNDLRAAAVAWEQRQMEEAKAVEGMGAIPELKVLHEQFVKLQAERVTAPFEVEVAKLNAGYVGGIEREIASEKKAGHLDGVIALEAEKKLVTEKLAVPAEDAVGVTEALKKLRGIYRVAYGKIEAVRVEGLKGLTDPLDTRLKQIEATLTQQDRIGDAKVVREYREGLAKGSAGTPARNAIPGGAAAKGNEADRSVRAPVKSFPPGDDRKAAEWVLGLGGKVTVREGDNRIPITKLENLSRSRFDLVEAVLSFTSPDLLKTPFENLDALAGLQELELLETRHVRLEDQHLAMLASLPKFKALSVSDALLTDDFCQYLSGTKSLEGLVMQNCRGFTGTGLGTLSLESLKSLVLTNVLVTDAGLADLTKFKKLTYLVLMNLPITDAALSQVSELRELKYLKIVRTRGDEKMKVTLAGLEKLKSLKKVETFGWTFTPGRMAEESAFIARLFPDLINTEMTGLPYSAEDIGALVAFKHLTTLTLTGLGANDATMQGLLSLPLLKTLSMKSGIKVTDAGLAVLAGHKAIEVIICTEAADVTDAGLLSLAKLKTLERLEVTNCSKITAGGVEAFKKVRPEVVVRR